MTQIDKKMTKLVNFERWTILTANTQKRHKNGPNWSVMDKKWPKIDKKVLPYELYRRGQQQYTSRSPRHHPEFLPGFWHLRFWYRIQNIRTGMRDRSRPLRSQRQLGRQLRGRERERAREQRGRGALDRRRAERARRRAALARWTGRRGGPHFGEQRRLLRVWGRVKGPNKDKVRGFRRL